MRCSQAEHLLSLNLDGRLSSGQRRVLADHLTACGPCASVERELSAARELALSLPVQRTSDSFREELWQRIRAGEGTPEAVFREPVPLASKVRYFTTGAAAAGLLILAAHWLRSLAVPKDAPAPFHTMVGEATSNPGRLTPRDVATGKPPVVPATPDGLAQLVAVGYADAVQKLRAKAEDLEARKMTPEGLEKLREQADRAGRFAGLLRWMVNDDYLRLAQDDVANLTTIEVLGEQVRDFRDADSLRRVLRPLRSLRVDQPGSVHWFCNPCVKDESGFHQEFLARVRSSQLDTALGSKIQVVVEPSPGGGDRVMVYVVR